MVHIIDKLIRPIMSAKNPIVGLPTMIPAENSPVTTLPCCAVRPILMAKSESEYITLTYPNNITNPHKITDTNPILRRRDKSNDRYRADIILIRSLRTTMTQLLTVKMQMAVIRKDHSREIFSIMRFVQMEKRTPPAPEPAAQIPIARARRLLNH